MWSSTRGKLTHGLKLLSKANGYLQRQKLSAVAADLTRFSDHQRDSIGVAVNTVGMQIEALVEGQDVLAEGLYRRTSEYSLGQHTDTRNAVKSVALTVQKTGRTLQQQVHADLNSILAEVRREVQGLHSKMDDAIVQKPFATEISTANHQVNLDEGLAIFSK